MGTFSTLVLLLLQHNVQPEKLFTFSRSFSSLTLKPSSLFSFFKYSFFCLFSFMFIWRNCLTISLLTFLSCVSPLFCLLSLKKKSAFSANSWPFSLAIGYKPLFNSLKGHTGYSSHYLVLNRQAEQPTKLWRKNVPQWKVLRGQATTAACFDSSRPWRVDCEGPFITACGFN